jgi:hypothetical protein
MSSPEERIKAEVTLDLPAEYSYYPIIAKDVLFKKV